MSLKKFNAFIVLISLTVMTLLYLYIAELLQNNIDAQVKNNVRSTTVELRQQLLNNFNTLQQRFGHYEEISLQKLQSVSEQITEDTTSVDLIAMASLINKNVFDGHYEIYIINEDKVVTKSTSQADIGLDYKEYPYFSKELDQLRSGSIEYKVSAPTFDEYALDIAQYYIGSIDNNKWLVIGFVLPFSEYVNYKTEDLKEVFPSLQNLDLFILTYDNLQYINNKVQKKKDFNRAMVNKERHAAMIMSDVGITAAAQSSPIEAIAERFTEQSITFLHNDAKKESVVYSLVESSFENPSDDFMLIAKVQFDQKFYLAEYAELKNLMYLFITLIYIFMILGFAVMYKTVIQKISGIEKQMYIDNPIAMDGFLFSEFSYFIKRYNSFLLRWKDEVRHLNKITMQDELTQCANRRYFNQKINEQIDLFKRYGEEFSMIMFDIDDFKSINDTYGHSKGDLVLTSMAKDVTKQLRLSDVLCRIGGEEFAIILPKTNRESAIFVAEKIREVIEKQNYIDGIKVTISLGAESYMEEYDFNSFYTTVDGFLYKSKHSGKNCVNSSISISS
ncbi:MAG: GGDEF domain-containing protein [Campylobacterota bacterium]